MAYILLLIRLTDNNQSFQEKEPAASSPASTDMSSKEIKDSQLILIRRNADLNQVCEKNNY